jgi:hypothetical protein
VRTDVLVVRISSVDIDEATRLPTAITAVLTFIYGPRQERRRRKPGAAAEKGQQVTISGCIQREAGWRKANDRRLGGAAGTGVGAGNEFVSANASDGGADATASAGAAYDLTGANEKLAAAHVGHRVEVTGTVKPGSATGGPTAGAPPRGTDVVSQDLQLRELESAA